VFVGDPNLSTVTAHRLTASGAFAALTAILSPNVEVTEVEFNATFTIETSSPAGVTSTRTGAGDPRYGALSRYFQTNPTPCWSFG
jgi:hypothetical protein